MNIGIGRVGDGRSEDSVDSAGKKMHSVGFRRGTFAVVFSAVDVVDAVGLGAREQPIVRPSTDQGDRR